MLLEKGKAAVAVREWPWLTSIAMEWIDRATPADGSSYANEGMHLIKMRWGKVVYLRAYLVRPVLISTCEGLAAPIED